MMKTKKYYSELPMDELLELAKSGDGYAVIVWRERNQKEEKRLNHEKCKLYNVKRDSADDLI